FVYFLIFTQTAVRRERSLKREDDPFCGLIQSSVEDSGGVLGPGAFFMKRSRQRGGWSPEAQAAWRRARSSTISAKAAERSCDSATSVDRSYSPAGAPAGMLSFQRP